MAKKKIENVCCEQHPGWFCIVLTLIGLYYLLVDLGYVLTPKITLLPVLTILVGLGMCAHTYSK